MENVLNKTSNYFRCIGTVYEKAIEKKAIKVKQYDTDKSFVGEVDGEAISGKISIRTSNGIMTFGVYYSTPSSYPNKDGEYGEGRQWGMAKKMLDWIPEINGKGKAPSKVNLEGVVENNDYSKDGKVYSNLRWRITKAEHAKTNEDGCSLNATCYIAKIAPETRNEEETGRLIVTLYCANNRGQCFPIISVVEADMADAFTDAYETEQTVNFDFDCIMRHVGGNRAGKKVFGKASSVTVSSGFDVEELVITGADEPIEEPDELTTEDENGNEVEVKTNWINPKTMKKAIKARSQMLEELKNKPTENKKPASFKENKAAMSKPKTKPVDDFEDELLDDDMPF
nr:MAG TPA: hypothetical protein [Caudoviricetes sp.]